MKVPKPPPSNITQLSGSFHELIVDLHDFVFGKMIGKGGFNKVYIGLQKATGVICAIKLLNYKDLKKDRFILYEREVRILATLSNPFILRFIGFTNRRPYALVTEYVPNGSLRDALRNSKSPTTLLNGTQRTVIAYGIAQGMQQLHELDIVHRDLKAANILLDEKFGPRIADFGLSRYTHNDARDEMTTEIGTVHWMAPELIEAKLYTEKVDVYAYGMILWELLTGKIPFHGFKGRN
jgi:serine/threonine protein kinase